MFKKPNKTQFLIRRIILSSIATLAVIIIATASILFMLGYRLDSGNRLEQGALLQFDSQPNGADVFIDTKNIGSKTATKQTVVAGTHTIKMTRFGYNDWQRTVDLKAGTLTWLDYTRFVPVDRPVESVEKYGSLTGISFSPDNRWAVAHEEASSTTFRLVDLRSEAVKSIFLTLPESTVTDAKTEGVTHSYAIASWDSGSRYVLIQHLYRDQMDWLVVDTQNASETVNVSQLLGVGFKDLKFAGTSGKTLYGLSQDGAIRKLDLSAGTLSRAFVTHVDSFSIFDNTIVSYTGTDPTDATKRVAGVYRDGDESAHILRSTTSPDTALKIATSRYFGDDFVAIAEENIVTVLKGKYPSSSSQDASSLEKLKTLQLTGGITALSFSPNGAYVLAQSGEAFKSYEIEHDRIDIGALAVAEGVSASSLQWLDQAHVWNDDAGKLTMRDFNGINAFDIMTVEPSYDATLSQNGRFFYGIGKTDNGYQLQRIKMILD